MNLAKHCSAFSALLLLARTFFCAVTLVAFTSSGLSQSNQKPPKVDTAAAATPSPSLVRSTTRREVRRIGYGGKLTVLGAPVGSVTIEAWPQAEVEVVADIELRADSEEDLARLAAVNNFLLDADLNSLRIVTTGTHDRKFMRAADKNFPKKLLSLPWKIDYRIRVPAAFDIAVYVGRGALNVAGIEGDVQLNASESTASLSLTGGSLAATIGRGSVTVNLPSRSWRGRGAEVRLGAGEMTIELPLGFNGDLNFDVLRAGRIDNAYPAITPRDGEGAPPPTAQSLHGRAGAGGATLTFAVGDGTLRIKQASRPEDR